MGPNNQQNGLSLAAPGYYSFGMLIHQWNHVVPILWSSHHYDRCALTALSGTNVCRFLLFRASMVRVPAYSCSGTRKYLGALRRVNPERTYHHNSSLFGGTTWRSPLTISSSQGVNATRPHQRNGMHTSLHMGCAYRQWVGHSISPREMAGKVALGLSCQPLPLLIGGEKFCDWCYKRNGD